MGTASSSNVAKVTTEAISKVATSIIQKTLIKGGQSQIISVVGGKGDLEIKNNKFTQKRSINMVALLKALVTQTAQQDLSVELAQQAKSLVSGINLFNFSDSSNEIDTFMKAAIYISTTISQTCESTSQQNQIIEVRNHEGKTVIANNSMDQVANIFSNCIEDVISNNEAIQKIQESLDQSATSETKGFSIWAIVALAIIALLFMAMPIILGSSTIIKVISKFMFPFLMLAGIIMIAIYFAMKKTVMNGYGFSQLISNLSPCGGIPGTTPQQYARAGEASEECKKDSNCKAVDWQGMTIDPDGKATVLTLPKTTFYSKVAHNPCANLVNKRDNLKIMRVPKIVVSAEVPSLSDSGWTNNLVQEGDIWINSKDSKWMAWDSDSQEFSSTNLANDDPLVPKFNSNKTLTFEVANPGSDPTTNGKEGDVVIKFAGKDSEYFYVYTFNKKLRWGGPILLNVPGKVPYVPIGKNQANITNSTAFKQTIPKYGSWMMIIGFALIGVGLFGTVYTFMIQPASDKKKGLSKEMAKVKPKKE